MKNKYFAHKSSYIDKNVKIGEGTSIWYFSHICEGAKIGKNCNIGQNVFVDKNVAIGNKVKIQNNVSVYAGVTIEDGAFLGPSCVFTNVRNPRSLFPRDKKDYSATLVGKGASIGANATIVCGNNIGNNSFIGAGAVVTKDTLPFSLMAGNPAKQIGWMCECGEKLKVPSNKNTAGCAHCGAKYVKKKPSKELLEIVKIVP